MEYMHNSCAMTFGKQAHFVPAIVMRIFLLNRIQYLNLYINILRKNGITKKVRKRVGRHKVGPTAKRDKIFLQEVQREEYYSKGSSYFSYQ